MFRGRLVLLVVLVGLVAPLAPAVAASEGYPLVPGQASHGTVHPHDGITIFLRYQDPDSLYAVSVNRRDHRVNITRKHRPGTGDDVDEYVRLEGLTMPDHTPVYDRPQRVTASAVNTPEGHVRISLFIDGELVHAATDDGTSVAGTPLLDGERIGLRTDNMEFTLDHAEVRPAGVDGRPTGAPILRDDFDYPDGLITNERFSSPPNALWRLTSGSLFARDGQGWSGLPDHQTADPESRWSNGSSVFRMITHRDDLQDVAVSMDITNHGYVGDPRHVAEVPPPPPPHYPTGEQAVAVDRREGRSNTHTAIAVSQRGFDRARDVVLVDADPQPEALSAAALAGSLGGPVLLTPRGALHADTASEIRRLRASRAHLVGSFDNAVVDALRGEGLTVRRFGGATSEAIAGDVARAVDGRGAYLVVTEDWRDAVAVSGAAAYRHQPVLLTPPDRLRAATARALDDLDTRRVTVVGTELAPQVVDDLRADGVTVDRAGFSRYSIARASADEQVASGASARDLWLAPGARPFHGLVGGPAAAARGGVLLAVDGNELGDVGPQDLQLAGYQSRHWARYHRHQLRQLYPIGQPAAMSNHVVNQVRAPQRTVLAGMTDVAGSAHERAIVWALEEGIATGYGDATFRPRNPVTRGQMATFLVRALDLEAGEATFSDVAGDAHEEAIRAVASAEIAGGFEDGTFRPGEAVTRGQMATFLTRALALPPGEATFSDVSGGPHAEAIGAVASAEIAGGYADGSYRPGSAVTREQMTTFLQRALE